MYCKNCGEKYVTDEAIICVKCGTKKNQGNAFCHFCGEKLEPNAEVCLKCGVAAKISQEPKPTPKSKIGAVLLGICFGYLGVHNFYLGYDKKGAIQLILFIIGLVTICLGIGVLFILATLLWGFIDSILILAGSTRTDAKGIPLE